jgi:GNAT superfamily N-acetyltransferase
MVTYQVERLGRFVGEIHDILAEHWEEIARDKDVIKLNPDWGRYEALDAAGVMFCVTARDDGQVAGYVLAYVQPHLHYVDSLTCFTDIFFMRKGYRRGLTGYKLLKFYTEQAKERGVQKIYMHTKLRQDIGPLLDRIGYSPIERVYALTFRD